MSLPFLKMHGAGNDFVIFDARVQPVSLTPQQARAVAARNNPTTRGCDQVIVIEPSAKADAFMRIYNADGGEVDACGNATRCLAQILEKELGRLPVTIETNAGLLQGLKKAVLDGQEYILVDMGKPRFGWQDIPLAMPPDAAAAKLEKLSGLNDPAFVSMGNPHVVFFLSPPPSSPLPLAGGAGGGNLSVDSECAERFPHPASPVNGGGEERVVSLAAVDLAAIGPKIEHLKAVFPEGVNVSVALLQGRTIHARVWERGAGLTQACGTAACAMLAAAHRRDPALRDAAVWFEPSFQMVSVRIEDNGHVSLGGPVNYEFAGTLDL